MERELIKSDDASGLAVYLCPDDSGCAESPAAHDGAVIFAYLSRDYENPAAKLGLDDVASIIDFERANASPKRGQYAAFPLFVYEHGNRVFQVSRNDRNPFVGRLPQGHAEFDSGRCGTVFVKLSEIAARNLPRVEKLALAYKAADSFCDEYSDWANGNVYGYVVENRSGLDEEADENEEGAELDSCWGFIGYDHAESSALESFDYYVKAAAAEREAARPALEAAHAYQTGEV